MDTGLGSGYIFVNCLLVVLIVWALFALGTQNSQPTTKKQGDKLSERGVSLVQAFFWLVIIVGFIGVIASSK
jgi:hypothetical protein